MSEVRDPGPEAADKILDGLEDYKWAPTDVARQARRLRAHIDELRAQIDALTPRYAQPCPAHEYIQPGCPDCGRLEKA